MNSPSLSISSLVDLPALSVLKGKKGAFTYVKNAQLHDIPNLTTCVLSNAFQHLETLDITDCSLLGEIEGIEEMIRTTEIELKEKERLEKEAAELEANKRPTLRTIDDWSRLVESIVEIISVGDNCCNEEGLDEMCLSSFSQLKSFSVGSRCFKNVCIVKFIGLNALETISIGDHSFYKTVPSFKGENKDDRQFILQKCNQLKEVHIDVFSFTDYSVCSIENNENLFVIEIGNLDDENYSNCFLCCSFSLKSITWSFPSV